MAAAKGNYIIVYKKISQVYAATTLETAVKTPLPKGCTLDDKMVLFMTYEPDTADLCIYRIDQSEIDKVTNKITKQKEALEESLKESGNSDEQDQDNS